MPQEMERALRACLRSRGTPLKSLGAKDLLDIGTRFWASTEVTPARPDADDLLFAYFEVVNRGRGILYEFGLNRIIRPTVAESDPYWSWIQGWKLRFSLAFKMTLQVSQLKPVVATFPCSNKARLAEFIDGIEAAPQFRVVVPYVQHSSGIQFSKCSAPKGELEHPTNGYMWARA